MQTFKILTKIMIIMHLKKSQEENIRQEALDRKE